jgi:acetyl-CoA carboxylase carboxyl transferase subunit alpha
MEQHLDFEKPIQLLETKLNELRTLSQNENIDFKNEISALEKKLDQLIDELFSKLTPWQRVQLSRHPNRPYTLDYIERIFSDFVELHGDRVFGDDLAMVTGFAKLENQSVCIIGQQKGRNTKQKIERNFGMVKPEGYRKAIRVMKLAEQFKLPIITFIDTPGAYPGVEAEERGQSLVIAESIMTMFELKVPIISVVIGEGGSGGALAIGIGDKVLMQKYSTYSVISPESCATILWSDSSKNEQAAEIMKMSADELLELKVIDGVIPEPKGGAHRDWDTASNLMKQAIVNNLHEILKLNPIEILNTRREKFRKIGIQSIVGM